MSGSAQLTAETDLTTFDHVSPAFSLDAKRVAASRLMTNVIDQCLNHAASLTTSDGVEPSEEALATFSGWLPLIFDRALKIGRWEIPHITCSDQGEIVCEWWNGEHKLTIYFGATPEYIKVWGTNIESEMESAELQPGWAITSIWLWLHST